MFNQCEEPLWNALCRSPEILTMYKEVINRYLSLKCVLVIQGQLKNNNESINLHKMFFNYESN